MTYRYIDRNGAEVELESAHAFGQAVRARMISPTTLAFVDAKWIPAAELELYQAADDLGGDAQLRFRISGQDGECAREELVQRIRSGELSEDILVRSTEMVMWLPARQIPSLAADLGGSTARSAFRSTAPADEPVRTVPPEISGPSPAGIAPPTTDAEPRGGVEASRDGGRWVGGLTSLLVWFSVFFFLSYVLPDGIAFVVALLVGAYVNHLWTENRERGGW